MGASEVTLKEERREIDEAELRSWLDVPAGFRLTFVHLRERPDERKVEIGFVKFEEASSISIETSRLLREDRVRAEIAERKAATT